MSTDSREGRSGRGNKLVGNQAWVSVLSPAGIDCVSWGKFLNLHFLFNKVDVVSGAHIFLPSSAFSTTKVG